MKDTVSVILPTYKREVYYLERALQSLLNQTYQNIEIVVVDDNIPNSSFRKKTKEFMEKYKGNENIVYVENPQNIGGALARNKGIEIASGSYITFLDDDDEYLPEKIQTQLAFMQENKFDMTFTNLKLVNEKNVVVDYRDHSYIKSFNNEELLKTHIMRKLTGTPTFMYRKEKIQKIGGFDDVPIGQEFHLMLKTIEGDLKIGFIPDSYVVAYRHNEGGISFGKEKIQGEKDQYRFVREKYFQRFSLRERMFIRFRYHVVFALAYKRNRQYIQAGRNGLFAFFASPLDALVEGIGFVVKVRWTRLSQRVLKSKGKKHD